MIPKIAHFHWTGPPMSWLRLMSIATFKVHNPGWEVRIHDTPDDIREKGLLYPQEADWTWWRVLNENGGLQVATDIVFLRPIPEEWLSYELCACRNGKEYVYHNAAIGCSKGHSFASRCEMACEGGLDRTNFQSHGPSLMKKLGHDFSSTKFFDQPMGAFCPVTFDKTPLLWGRAGVDIPESSIGVHWYGGDSCSRDYEQEALPGSNHFIVKLAEEQLQLATQPTAT